jgi:hypothetical protein
VQCCCGVGDDDGERMIMCDSCGFWVHTRCNGLRDNQQEPSGFACKPCREAAAAAAAAGGGGEAAGEGAAGSKRVRQGSP